MSGLDLRFGDWRDVAADITCDALISDPPFGARTHDSKPSKRDADADGLAPRYEAWTPADVHEFVASWSPRVRGWMVTLTSHDLVPAWEAAYRKAKRCCFAPVPCVISAMSVRLQNDGPSSWSVLAIVARPRRKEFLQWGTLPGAYVGNRVADAGGGRGKPAWLINALVRDYSRRGDVVVDPCAGWGSTLEACIANGRVGVGCEVDRAAYDEAERRLSRMTQMDLLAMGAGT